MANNAKTALIVGLIALIIIIIVIVIGTSAYLLMQSGKEQVSTTNSVEQVPIKNGTTSVSMDTRPKVKYVRVEKQSTSGDTGWKLENEQNALKKQSIGGNYLQLAEVVVWSNGKNVAPLGTATQSSTCYDGPPSKAIDGNKSGLMDVDKSVSHTCSSKLNWWEVKLDKEYPVEYVEIYNRADCCWTRLDGAKVKLLDKNKNVLKSFDLKGVKTSQKFMY